MKTRNRGKNAQKEDKNPKESPITQRVPIQKEFSTESTSSEPKNSTPKGSPKKKSRNINVKLPTTDNPREILTPILDGIIDNAINVSY